MQTWNTCLPDCGLPQPRSSGGRGPQAQSPIPLCPVSVLPGGQPHDLLAGQWVARVPSEERKSWAVTGEGSEGTGPKAPPPPSHSKVTWGPAVACPGASLLFHPLLLSFSPLLPPLLLLSPLLSPPSSSPSHPPPLLPPPPFFTFSLLLLLLLLLPLLLPSPPPSSLLHLIFSL